MTRLIISSLVVVAVVVTSLIATSGVASTSSDDWTTRLEALRPEDPLAYFELAEELADVADNHEARLLVQRLFALAGSLDPAHLGRSACLALADFETDDTARRRLLALASLLGGAPLGAATGVETHDPGGILGEEVSLGAVIGLTESFSYYRRGEGPRALVSLREPGATELLTAYDWLIPGGIHRYTEDARLHRRLRPNISEEYLVRMLEFEIGLLAGPERPWSSDLLLSRGRPLIEVDPDKLAETLGTNPDRVLFRRGHWVAEE